MSVVAWMACFRLFGYSVESVFVEQPQPETSSMPTPRVRDRRGGSLHYVIGNASFYGELVPAEALLAELMERAGFVAPEVELLRKRNSKKELFEFVVHARG